MTNQLQNQNNQMQQQPEKKNAIVMKVAEKIQEMQNLGQINLPDNYSATNALQAAYFTLTEVSFGKTQTLLEKTTPESVAFALQDMAIQGLSVAKTQGYFVPYGNKLQFQRSYHGTQAILKRLHGVKDVWANVIWNGDEFEVDYNQKGRLQVTKHKPNWEAATGKKEDIRGSYCVIEKDDGELVVTIMTMAEINTAWSTSKNTSVQNKYPQEMAKRTVINRGAKSFINTSDDSDVLIAAVNRTTENEYDNETRDMGDIEEVRREIETHANTEVLDFVEEPQVIELVTDVQEDPGF